MGSMYRVRADPHRETALATVEAVLVDGHAHSDATLLVGARLAQALHLAVVIDTVELEHREFHRLVHVLHLLRLGVCLLLTLLTPTAKTKHLLYTGKHEHSAWVAKHGQNLPAVYACPPVIARYGSRLQIKRVSNL